MEKQEQNYNILDWFKKVVLENYANFEGRARRKEYWSFILVYMMIYIPLYVFTIVSMASDNPGFGISGVLLVVFALAMFIPNFAVAVRRLHDVNKSGWYLLIGLIPLAGIYLLVLMFSEGTNGPNDYGKDPKHINEMNEIGTPQE
jgi:uncharacterized membrane protein YhaH (DUF805 family)